jgi:beta-N-acetylhexosaminidase
MIKKLRSLSFPTFLFIFNIAFSQAPSNKMDLVKQAQWVDSVYASFTLEEKIGQLYMPVAHTNANMKEMEELILKHHIGGLCFMQGTAADQITYYNRLLKISKLPLWISTDAEWGLGMRINGVDNLPRALTLGAMQDSSMAYEVGACIARQCKLLGVHINFAPVIDVNANPNNPVINFRSFGENKNRVANTGILYMKGLQDNGVFACAKHFPGHGNTETDSHIQLPVIKSSAAELDTVDLIPFKRLFEAGLKSVMLAHLCIPAYDDTPNMPATLSVKVVDELLRNKLQFKGIVFTDALNMSSVSSLFTPAQLDVKALQAGNDVLLFSKNIPEGVLAIKQAITEGQLSEERIKQSVQKILQAKYELGLYNKIPLDTSNIISKLNKEVSNLKIKVAEAAITCVRDTFDLLARIKNQEAKNMVYVGVGVKEPGIFVKQLIKQGLSISSTYCTRDTTSMNGKAYQNTLKAADAIIVGVHGMDQRPSKNFGLDSTTLDLLNELIKFPNAIFVFFGNPYALKFFCNIPAALIGYNEDVETQISCARLFTKALHPKGILPVSACSEFKEGTQYKSSRW